MSYMKCGIFVWKSVPFRDCRALKQGRRDSGVFGNEGPDFFWQFRRDATGNRRRRSDFVLGGKWRVTVFISTPSGHQFLRHGEFGKSRDLIFLAPLMRMLIPSETSA
jgi:hypothetical protein